MKTGITLWLIFLLITPSSLMATWSVPSANVPFSDGTWHAGVGGTCTIPNATTVFTTLNAIDNTGTTDVGPAINTALSSASAAGSSGNLQVVVLPAGRFRISTDIVGRQFSVLRGQGTNSTILVGDQNLNGNPYDLTCMIIVPGLHFGDPTPQGVNIWTGSTLTQYSTSLSTVSAVNSTLSVGDYIVIDQLNDRAAGVNKYGFLGDATSDNASNNPNNSCGDCSRVGDTAAGDRSRMQVVKVTAISNGTNITFAPGLFGAMNTAQTPQIYFQQRNGGAANFIQQFGVENLTVQDTSSSSPNHVCTVMITHAADCWFKNVAIVNAGTRTQMRTDYAFQCEVRDCVLDQAGGVGSSSGGAMVAYYYTCACAFHFNIITRAREPWTSNGAGSANVVAHNYIDYVINSSQDFVEPALVFHGAHQWMTLVEGNICNKFMGDFIHGSSGQNFLFRNWFYAQQRVMSGTTNSQYLCPVMLMETNWNYTVAENILGKSGLSTTVTANGGANTYELNSPTALPGFVWGSQMYMLGYDSFINFGPDGTTKSTLTRSNNWDSVNVSIQNSQAGAPNSFYLASAPPEFANMTYPGIAAANGGTVTIDAEPEGYLFNHGFLPAGGGSVPTVTTISASSISSNSVVLNSLINPNSADTSATFSYGLTTGYGSLSSSADAGSGSGNASVSISVSGLSPNTLYHFKANGTNTVGGASGSDTTFVTQPVYPVSYK